ncbi:MAG: hypothetical protein HY674_03880 [Chloroflexi bacterium]|nr:hypothetical protein [Chloroflexota bacterium]
MTNRLKACWKQRMIAAPGKAARRWFHLVVEARYAPDYWLHLQAPANCTFGDLDNLLRAIWLECCDHLSAFQFPVKRSPPRRANARDIAVLFEALVQEAQQRISDDASSDRLMDERLGNRLQPGVVFSHEYDFGTTTELALRVAGEYTAPAVKGALKLLARNEPPNIPCSVCKKPATQLCRQCADDGDAEFCDACAGQHDCDPEMLVPLINSPRTGVCGYCGPSIEP